MVSVIVPVYNVQDYLEKCVNSILAQTYQDFELILVDDGSTDNSPAICDLYLTEKKVTVIHKDNGGLSTARNAGLDIAKGKYIYFVDSDDYIEQDLLEKTIAVMDEQQLDCVCFGMIKETIGGETLEEIHFIPREIHIHTERDRLEFLLKYLLNYRLGWEACNRIYRAEIIQTNHLRFVSERRIFAEDMLFSFMYWLYADSCQVLGECLYHYVQRNNSLLNISKSKNILPQVYELSREAYGRVLQRKLPLIQEHYLMVHLHFLEWQCRTYIADKGVAWVKRELKGLDSDFFLKEGISLEQAYKRSLQYCGRWDGFVSIVIPVMDAEHLEKAKEYIRHLKKQTLQKMDIILLVSGKILLEEEDLRIRQISIESFSMDCLVRTAFKESYGEYLYFADLDVNKPEDFLCRGCDILKYNNCGVVIFTAGQSGFVDKVSLEDRYSFRKYLGRNRIPSHAAMVQSDLLRNSGLSELKDLQKYMVEILLTEHVIMIDEEKM